MQVAGGRQYIALILAASFILAVASSEEASTLPPSHKPKLFSLFDSGEGLILICIGVDSTSNITWYWRQDGSDMILPIPEHEDFRTHQSKYWMIFRNEMQATSRLEIHGLTAEYNNTNFICSSHGHQEEYMYTVKETSTVGVSSTMATRHASHPEGLFPHIFSSLAHVYVGDTQVLECTFTLRNSPVKWNLEYAIDQRDVNLPETESTTSENGKVIFSKTVIHDLKPEHNNAKVICENEEGRAEYVIHLGQKKLLHERCREHDECADVNSYCRNHYCSCKKPYVSHNNNNGWFTCMESKIYRQRCTHTVQCTDTDPKMTCARRRCKCQQGYFYDGIRCSTTKSKLGDICFFDGNCDFTYGICRNASDFSKECTCQDGFRSVGTKCISQHLQGEEHMFRVGFLTAVIILVVLTLTVIILALKSARLWYMRRKRSLYREVIMGEQNLSISSRVARHGPSSKADIVTRGKTDLPCGTDDVTFTSIHLTPPVERREMKKPGEDKTVCVPETIPFIHMEQSSNC